MPPLRDLQRALAGSLAAGTTQPVTALLAAEEAAPRNVALYRRLIRNNYIQVLKVTYPALHRWIGDRFLTKLARAYLKQYPSVSGDLFHYGRCFPTFLQRIDAPPALMDLARLEWACHEMHQAVDASPASVDDAPPIVSADPSRTTLRFHPAARFLLFHRPIHRLWLALQAERISDDDIALTLPEEPTVIVVTRANGRVQVTPLTWLDYRLLEALSLGTDLGSLGWWISAFEPSFDLVRFLTTMLDREIIIGVAPKAGR